MLPGRNKWAFSRKFIALSYIDNANSIALFFIAAVGKPAAAHMVISDTAKYYYCEVVKEV